MSGELSPDRQYYWDGSRWANAVTPDGAWRWDGAAWKQPGKTSRMTPRLAVLVAVGAVAALLLAGVGLAFVIRLVNNEQAAIQARIGPACAANGLAGASVAEGATVCGRKLGLSIVSTDCTKISALPSSLVAVHIQGTGNDWSPADVGLDSSGCELTAQPDEIVAINSNDVQSPVIVLIADFVPIDASGAVGLRLACSTSASCVDIGIYPDQAYSLDEAASKDTWKNLTHGPLVFTQLNVGRENRLILRFAGGVASVYLNGFEVTHATPTQAQLSGYFAFYAQNEASTAVEHITLHRLYVFQSL